MTTLYLCEKPSAAGDIAKILGIKRRHNGYYELNNGDLVTNAVGHLLELEAPEKYNPDWKRWSWATLPMVREVWRYEVVARTKDQFKVIKDLLKTAKRVVIATDAGREGELIGRLILEQCKFRGTVDRFWTSALTPAAIKAGLDNLRPGSATEPLYQAARARQRSDNIYGFTASRAATLAARVARESFPMGRVQTPVLAMVAMRDETIRNFKSGQYFELEAEVRTRSGKTLKMRHAPDVANRITSKTQAQALLDQALHAQGPLKVTNTDGTEGAPLPFSLPALQKEANRLLGFSAKNTLALAQALYEKKVTSYPRTDSRHLSQTQIPEVPGVLVTVGKHFPDAVKHLQGLGVIVRNSTFDDSKLSDHHGIVPTDLFAQLEGAELQLYTLICQQYLRALAPDLQFAATRVEMDANGVPFKATGRTTKVEGWKSLKLL